MIETIIYIVLAVLLIGSAHIWSAIKSGCFYAKCSGILYPKLLKKYILNLHYVQTPFWYSLFGAFGILLIAIFRLLNPQIILLDILSAYLISQGTSTLCGPFYQGFINVGSNLPFIDPNENKSMELANPLTNKTHWIKRFWYGKNRIYLAFIGLLMIIIGIFIQF
jgi:hypothetical protein